MKKYFLIGASVFLINSVSLAEDSSVTNEFDILDSKDNSVQIKLAQNAAKPLLDEKKSYDLTKKVSAEQKTNTPKKNWIAMNSPHKTIKTISSSNQTIPASSQKDAEKLQEFFKKIADLKNPQRMSQISASNNKLVSNQTLSTNSENLTQKPKSTAKSNMKPATTLTKTIAADLENLNSIPSQSKNNIAPHLAMNEKYQTLPKINLPSLKVNAKTSEEVAKLSKNSMAMRKEEEKIIMRNSHQKSVLVSNQNQRIINTAPISSHSHETMNLLHPQQRPIQSVFGSNSPQHANALPASSYSRQPTTNSFGSNNYHQASQASLVMKKYRILPLKNNYSKPATSPLVMNHPQKLIKPSPIMNHQKLNNKSLAMNHYPDVDNTQLSAKPKQVKTKTINMEHHKLEKSGLPMKHHQKSFKKQLVIKKHQKQVKKYLAVKNHQKQVKKYLAVKNHQKQLKKHLAIKTHQKQPTKRFVINKQHHKPAKTILTTHQHTKFAKKGKSSHPLQTASKNHPTFNKQKHYQYLAKKNSHKLLATKVHKKTFSMHNSAHKNTTAFTNHTKSNRTISYGVKRNLHHELGQPNEHAVVKANRSLRHQRLPHQLSKNSDRDYQHFTSQLI